MDKMIFKQNLFVFKFMRIDVVKLIHQRHMGVEKSKNRAWILFSGLGMNVQIEEMTVKYPACIHCHTSNPRDSIILHSISSDSCIVLQC